LNVGVANYKIFAVILSNQQKPKTHTNLFSTVIIIR